MDDLKIVPKALVQPDIASQSQCGQKRDMSDPELNLPNRPLRQQGRMVLCQRMSKSEGGLFSECRLRMRCLKFQ